MEKDNKKVSFTVVDLFIILFAALTLFFVYNAWQNRQKSNDKVKETVSTAIMQSTIKYDEHLGKVTVGDSLFDKDGTEIGKILSVEYNIDEKSGNRLTLKCEFKGKTYVDSDFFVNTSAYCDTFKVLGIENVREE